MMKFIRRLGLGEYILIVCFGGIIAAAKLAGLSFASGIGGSFWLFFTEMIAFLPIMFILIGLIDVWFPREKVERHIGKDSGIKGIAWVVLFAMLQAGPLYGAFPVAYILWKKGSSVKNIFIYLGAFATMKIPMLTFEIGFLGFRFSVLRTLFTLPVFILIGFIMEYYFREKEFGMRMPEGKNNKGGVLP